MTDTRFTDPRRAPPRGACSVLRRRGALLVALALLGCQAQRRPASSVPAEVTSHGIDWLPSVTAARPTTPAIALTASDGTGLRLVELRARAWLEFGLYGVEQWAPVDLPRLLVTCGRRRAIPGA